VLKRIDAQLLTAFEEQEDFYVPAPLAAASPLSPSDIDPGIQSDQLVLAGCT